MESFDLWDSAQEVDSKPEPEILTVSGLTKEIRRLLERQIGEVWVSGELSNFRSPGSGHLYFSLKDEGAVISAVMFRHEASRLAFSPKDGISVKALGRVTVYEARGQYQIVLSLMEPLGKGTLQERFEALKRRLQAEGLFEAERKRPLPVFPEKVGIITSLQGAVLQDFCRILARRAPGIRIAVYGARVQGTEAPGEIVAGLREFNARAEVDLIVVARGGGSLEDLWAFNEESVARAIAASELPTISAVGHETDFTIADFVADLRAPTPSAAAELLSRDWAEWRSELGEREQRLVRAIRLGLQSYEAEWRRLAESYVFREPGRIVQIWQQKLDDLSEQLTRSLEQSAGARRSEFDQLMHRWEQADPRRGVKRSVERLDQWEARLRSLAPEATLARGFALVTDSQGRLLRDSAQIQPGHKARVRLAKGELAVVVERSLSSALE